MNERFLQEHRENITDFENDDSVTLVTELTGLIPSPPGCWDEAVAFTELGSIFVPAPQPNTESKKADSKNDGKESTTI